MFSRYFETAFWHFYDSLGFYTVLAAILGIVILALGTIVEFCLPYSVFPLLIAAFLLFVAICMTSAGQVNYCLEELALRNSKFQTYRDGIKKYAKYYVVFFLGYVFVNCILAVNLMFYFSMGTKGQYSMIMFCLFALMIFFIVLFNILCLIAFSLPVYCKKHNLPFKSIIRLSLQSFFIWPLFWLCVTVLALIIAPILFISIVGIPMLITLVSVTSSVGFNCTIIKNEKLIEARDQLGVDVSIRVLKQKSEHLASEEYLRTYKRSFREILKPWE